MNNIRPRTREERVNDYVIHFSKNSQLAMKDKEAIEQSRINQRSSKLQK